MDLNKDKEKSKTESYYYRAERMRNISNLIRTFDYNPDYAVWRILEYLEKTGINMNQPIKR